MEIEVSKRVVKTPIQEEITPVIEDADVVVRRGDLVHDPQTAAETGQAEQ